MKLEAELLVEPGSETETSLEQRNSGNLMHQS